MRAGVVVFLIGCGRLGFDEVDLSQATSTMPRLVQQAAVLETSDTASADLGPTTRGNLIVAATVAITNSTHVLSVGDDVGDAFTSAGAMDICNDRTVGEVWYATAGTVPATVVTVSASDTDDRELWVLELVGVSELDQIATIDNTAATDSVAAPPISPSQLPAIVVSEINDPAEIGSLVTPGFIALPDLHGDDAAYAVVTTPGSYGARWLNQTEGLFCGFTVAFH